MLTIRKEQSEALARYVEGNFRARLASHLRDFFPDKAGPMEDKALQDLISQGMLRAKNHGLATERDMVRFIDLTFFIRQDFDSSPETSWARRIMVDRALTFEDRLEKLYFAAKRRGYVLKGPDK